MLKLPDYIQHVDDMCSSVAKQCQWFRHSDGKIPV